MSLPLLERGHTAIRRRHAAAITLIFAVAPYAMGRAAIDDVTARYDVADAIKRAHYYAALPQRR